MLTSTLVAAGCSSDGGIATSTPTNCAVDPPTIVGDLRPVFSMALANGFPGGVKVRSDGSVIVAGAKNNAGVWSLATGGGTPTSIAGPFASVGTFDADDAHLIWTQTVGSDPPTLVVRER